MKIGFVLLSNSQNPIPSTRINVLNMFPYLEKANIEPSIIYEPQSADERPNVDHLLSAITASGINTVYFQKVYGPSVEKLAAELAQIGIKTIYGVCDLINEQMTHLTDETIVVTEYLKDLYPLKLRSKVSVIHDGVEKPDIFKTGQREHWGKKGDPIDAILVTSSELTSLPIIKLPPKWLRVTIVGKYPKKKFSTDWFRHVKWNLEKKDNLKERIEFLRFLFHPRIQCKAWDKDEVYQDLLKADVGIIPIDQSTTSQNEQLPPFWKLKSENRLTLKMSIGLPVIATSIPSYTDVVENGINGFLVESPEEWLTCLMKLRDPEIRANIGKKARLSVIDRFSTDAQAEKLIRTLLRIS